MIIEYDEQGQIGHVVNDPIPQGLIEALDMNGATYLNLPPIPWPDEPQFEPDGSPMMEQITDSDGNPLFEEVVTEEVDPETEETVQRVVRVPVMQHVWASNGVDYAKVDLMRDYVVHGAIARRPDCTATVTTVGRTVKIENLPDDATVSVVIEGESFPLDETEFEIDEPGTIRILVDAPWPMLQGVYDVEIQ